MVFFAVVWSVCLWNNYDSARSDWLRGVFALEYVNMVVTSRCFGFRALITREKTWKKFWVEKSTSLLYLPIPSTVMQTLDFVSGLHNWREFSPNPSRVYTRGYANTESVITCLESQIKTSSRPLRTFFFSTHFIYSNVIVQGPEWSVGADLLCRPQPHRVWAQVLPDRKGSPCSRLDAYPFATTKQYL